jgi:DNA replication protein DnaC
LAPVETLEQLVLVERRERERRNLERWTRATLLGNVVPIDRFDGSHPRRIDRGLVEDLRGLGFVERHENVLFRGPSGVGKTMLARCLGLAALTQGHAVQLPCCP